VLTYSEEGSELWDQQRTLRGPHLHNLIARKEKVTYGKQEEETVGEMTDRRQCGSEGCFKEKLT